MVTAENNYFVSIDVLVPEFFCKEVYPLFFQK
jgi:hypothetical protein